MATGWQREFTAANRQVNREWNEKCLREDIQNGQIEGKSVLWIAARYDLSERKVKRILWSKNENRPIP